MQRQGRLFFVLASLIALAGCGSEEERQAIATATPSATERPTPSVTTVPSALPTASAAPIQTATPEPTREQPSATPVTSRVNILSPQNASTVESPVLSIAIEVAGAGAVIASLNDAPLTLLGGPNHYTASVNPGAPLRDDNLLRVRLQGDTAVEATASFRYLPPKARLHRIADAAELLQGPLAHNQLGDYMLANDVARFVVQDVAKRDLYSVGAFGGNIIDAELVAKPGTDNFLEIQPTLNIETVVNAQTAEIVNDGQDGTAAILRTCGPDDLLDFVNPSTILEDRGLNYPSTADDADFEIEACTDYLLEAGKPYVQMVTTVFNNEDRDLGLFVGDFINGSGELEQWTSSGAGLGELLTAGLGVLSYIGFGEATGVDYSHVTVPVLDSPSPRSSFFTAAGVSYVMQSNSIASAVLGGPPTFVVPAHGSKSYSRYFGVGNGSGGNAITLENEVKGLVSGTVQGCITAGGQRLPGTKVSMIRRDAGRGLSATYVTDGNGCFGGTLIPGVYDVGASRRGFPNEQDAMAPAFHRITIAANQTTRVDIALPSSGRLAVSVHELHAGSDQPPSPVPARVSVIGFDPSPESVLVADLITGRQSTGIYNDISADAVPFGFVWMDYAGADGQLAFDLEPGSYHLFVSRGTEYSRFEQPIEITAGNVTSVAATIVRVLDTPGYVSSDFHVHSLNSADSRVSLTNRALQFAGEGIDNVIMTDHHAHTDLTPTIARLNLSEFLHATIGEEITTWDYGHFNAYPLKVDPTRPSKGSTDWAKAAPPGRDFPAYGSYTASPAEIQSLATEGSTSLPDTTIQINHIDSFFAPLRIDTALVPPQTFISQHDRQRFRLDPNGGELFAHFRALELWNGAGRGAQEEFINHRLGIWMNHLNQGLLTTFIADTDTHEFRNLNTAGARTWTAASEDQPALIDSGEVARSVDAGKAVGGQGVYVQAHLVAADGSAGSADFSLNGSNIVRSDNGAVDLVIDVQAPLWAEYDRIDVYANAPTIPTLLQDGVPVLFTATATQTLRAGADFTVNTVPIVAGVAAASRRETHLNIPFRNLSADTWFVVMVRGTDGLSRPMFPVFDHDLNTATNRTLPDLLDGNLGEGGVLAMGVTNALYADVDSVAGFQAPLAARH